MSQLGMSYWHLVEDARGAAKKNPRSREQLPLPFNKLAGPKGQEDGSWEPLYVDIPIHLSQEKQKLHLLKDSFQ